ncbi:hypothetical protein F2Q69_00024346 [Brassica cretica]|uniref:Uncharacterized protein n=1 Tax=Brassica cretica TaxID=69181 RepID=A0A8S9Q9X2_BRACR|nr:hypothetical protein F2Q69_00024346 [Brassica cretica]
MSSGVYYRSWMDKPHMDPNTNLLTEEYVQGIGEFMKLVEQQPDAKTGFSRNYKVWYLHRKTGYEYGSTSEPQPVSEPQPDISHWWSILLFLTGRHCSSFRSCFFHYEHLALVSLKQLVHLRSEIIYAVHTLLAVMLIVLVQSLQENTVYSDGRSDGQQSRRMNLMIFRRHSDKTKKYYFVGNSSEIRRNIPTTFRPKSVRRYIPTQFRRHSD